jgi:signal transduction histidine kinase
LTNRKLIALGLFGLALCALSAIVAGTDPAAPGRTVRTTVSVLTIAALLGVGLYAWHRDDKGRFGPILFLTGITWFFVTLSNADGAFLYSVGRISGWIFEVVLAWALLSYPIGRLESRGARAVVIGGALLIGLFYIPTIPLTAEFPLPAPFTSCTTDCPQNFFLAGSEPAFLVDVVKPIRDSLAILVYLGAVFVLATRLRNAGHNERRTLVPVLSAATLRFLAAIVYVSLRRVGAHGAATALGFLVGLLQWRIYSGRALGRLTTGLSETRNPSELRDLVAEALEEPATEVFWSDAPTEENGTPPAWHASSGTTLPAPIWPRHSLLHEAEAESGLRVAVACEEGFRDRPEFLDAVCACIVSGLERQRLDAALADSLADVAASRKRLVGAADSARQKIERDLHDGAQQQLVALRVKLELAREALEADPAEATELVAGLGPQVEEIIEEVRALARGIYPALLASDGLGEALRAAGQRSAIPVTIEADGIGRLSSETESAVYFCCLEAMQNVGKHGTGASRVTIELHRDGDLRFAVADDGCGFVPGRVSAGSGLTGMRDRLAAVGGELRIESSPGAGTRIEGRVPLT